MSSTFEVLTVVLGGNAVFIWLIMHARKSLEQLRPVFDWFGVRELGSVSDDELKAQASKCRVFGWVGLAVMGATSLVVALLVGRSVMPLVAHGWPTASYQERFQVSVVLVLGVAALIEAPLATWTAIMSDSRVMTATLESRGGED